MGTRSEMGCGGLIVGVSVTSIFCFYLSMGCVCPHYQVFPVGFGIFHLRGDETMSVRKRRYVSHQHESLSVHVACGFARIGMCSYADIPNKTGTRDIMIVSPVNAASLIVVAPPPARSSTHEITAGKGNVS